MLNTDIYLSHPLGTVFHIVPSNVDTIFLYSICISLLCGNKNIIRASSTINSVVGFIIEILNKVIAENKLFNEYIHIISYGHDDEINQYLSEKSKCRIIWGGNHTVNYFKNIHPNVYTKDIFFPNKISHSLLNCHVYCSSTSKEKSEVARLFFNDAYLFDQMGCSSPRIIYVLGSQENKNKFMDSFYEELSKHTAERYRENTMALSTLKFNALITDSLNLNPLKVLKHNNSIYFIEISGRDKIGINCGGGYFFIKHITKPAQIISDISEKTQTLTHYGFGKEELMSLHHLFFGKQIDRIVPIGQALSFDYVWDGMNLFDELTRKRKIY